MAGPCPAISHELNQPLPVPLPGPPHDRSTRLGPRSNFRSFRSSSMRGKADGLLGSLMTSRDQVPIYLHKRCPRLSAIKPRLCDAYCTTRDALPCTPCTDLRPAPFSFISTSGDSLNAFVTRRGGGARKVADFPFPCALFHATKGAAQLCPLDCSLLPFPIFIPCPNFRSTLPSKWPGWTPRWSGSFQQRPRRP